MNINRISLWIGIVFVIFIAAFFAWFFFFRSTANVSTGTPSTGFGTGVDTTNTTPASTDTNGTQSINTTPAASAQKIFKIIDGPIVGATLLQTLRPTTTIARYIRQDDGHVFDVPLGVAGAVPRVVSNITIPGGQHAIWLEGGNAALLQYVDDSNIVKTVYLGFPVATTSTVQQSTRIQFLPDNIIDIAGSPDGKSLVYLIKTANGSDGYIARSDGTNSRKTFSLALSQLLISWPAPNTILVQTKSAAGIQGMAFAINATTGSATQLVTAAGLTAIGNSDFSSILYQINQNNLPVSYLYNTKTAVSMPLTPSFMPEKCNWSHLLTTKVYCASPLSYPANKYVDLWHMGAASTADTIFSINTTSGISTVITIPGSTDGGAASDILEMSLSSDEHYLSYMTKGDRSLWGVLLGN
jgi:hypothetical protein